MAAFCIIVVGLSESPEQDLTPQECEPDVKATMIVSENMRHTILVMLHLYPKDEDHVRSAHSIPNRRNHQPVTHTDPIVFL